MGVMAIACGAFAFGIGTVTAEAEADGVTFEINAVSLREVNESYTNAVRFRVQMDKDSFDSNATYGAKLLPKAMLNGGALEDSTDAQIKDVAISATDWVETTADNGTQAVMETVVYVYDIEQRYYGTQIAVVAYSESNGARTYTEEVSCSLAEVALTAQGDNLESYYTFDYKFYNDDEEYAVGSAIYGNKLTAPTEAPEKNGYTFSEWTDASGNYTWDFDGYTVSGNVNLYAKYDLIKPTQTTDSTLKLVDKKQTVDYTAWAGDTSAWDDYYDVAWKLGNVTVTGNDWTAMADGVQTLSMVATSKLESDKVFTAYTATVDVYDSTEEVPKFIGSLNDIKGTNGYSWGSANSVQTEIVTYQGKQAVKISCNGEGSETRLMVLAKPLHSQEYYTMWDQKGTRASLKVHYYLPSGGGWTSSYNQKGVEANKTNTLSWGNFVEDEWTFKDNWFDTFLSYCDNMVANYENGFGCVTDDYTGNCFAFSLPAEATMEIYISDLEIYR